jgi:hypothetical protein
VKINSYKKGKKNIDKENPDKYNIIILVHFYVNTSDISELLGQELLGQELLGQELLGQELLGQELLGQE